MAENEEVPLVRVQNSSEPTNQCFQIYKESLDGSVGTENTDAYGQMEFFGPDRRTRAQYVRLCDETPMENVEEFMKTTMSLEKWPKMMISIVGSLSYFRISEKFKESLQNDLLKVFRKVAKMEKETWFITYGADSGVTKLIAEAVDGYKYQDTSVLGIIPWNSVAKKELLVQSPNIVSIPKYPIKKVFEQIQKQKATTRNKKPMFYLNKDHTHFFLVDTGPEKSQDREKNMKFRSKFNNFILKKQLEAEKKKREETTGVDDPNKMEAFMSEDKMVIPAIHLLINGGRHALKEIQSTLLPEDDEPIVPVIVFEDSGRAANCISLACRIHDRKLAQEQEDTESTVSAVKENLLNINLLKEEIGKNFAKEEEEIHNLVMRIVRERRDYITIYSVNDNLEDKVLWSILERGSSNKNDVTLHQLKMTMLWERPDIAETMMKRSMNGLQSSKDLKRIMRELLEKALIDQNVQFIDLIFELGFDMHRVNSNMMTRLYEKALDKDVKSKRNVLNQFMAEGSTIENVYLTINRIASLNLLKPTEDKLDEPFKKLFLWAIMCNKVYTAIAVAKRGDNPLAKMLVARGMIIRMIEQYERSPIFDETVKKNFERQIQFFEDRALELLDKCSQADITKTRQLIAKPLPNWANKNIIQLAAISTFQEFIGNPRCKDVVDDEWQGNLTIGEYLNTKVFFGIFFLPFMFYFLHFKDKHYHKDGRCCKYKDVTKPSYCQSLVNVACTIRGVWDKTRAFYTAPITKCFTYWMIYMVFLCTFAFVIVNKATRTVDIAEHCLLAFTIAILLGEVRQMTEEHGMATRRKLNLWWENHWNKVDIMAVFFFIIGYILNRTLPNSSIPYARYFYAIDVILWVLKLLQFFSLNFKIGIYVVMLQRMLMDVTYFVLIIMVFVMAYALARFSILYPDNVLSEKEKTMAYFTRNLVMVPFFQLFGEVFIEDPATVEANMTVFGTPVVSPGRVSETVAMYLTYGYMVLGNLLLVNLLIAVFNNTYTEVQAKSGAVWHFQNYQLVHEYQERPFLPVPLSIICQIKDALRCVYRRLRKLYQELISKKDDTNKGKCVPIKEYFKIHSDLYKLLQFENECFVNYLQDQPKFENTLNRLPVFSTKEQWLAFQINELFKNKDSKDLQNTYINFKEKF